MIDVLIVGSGPAGLSAAVYASRAGLSTRIVEGETKGGLLTTTEQVDNYLGLYGSGGLDMADNFTEHATKFGAEFIPGTASEIKKVEASDGIPEHFVTSVNSLSSSVGVEEIESRTVIYSAGSTPKKLGVVGEDLMGVSYCATCDGLFFAGKKVIVVGGGESAVEEALYLAPLASEVTVLLRGDKWRASEAAVEKLTSFDNVEVRFNTSVLSMVEAEKPAGQSVGLGTFSSLGSVSLDDGSSIDADGIFIAIGQSPNSEVGSPHSVLLEDGFIQCSNVDGFFVAGDISDSEYRQVAVAVGDGAKSGVDATRYISTLPAA